MVTEEAIKALDLTGASVILLKYGTVDPVDLCELLAADPQGRFSDLSILMVKDFDDLKVFDEEQMNAAGWFRKSGDSGTAAPDSASES